MRSYVFYKRYVIRTFYISVTAIYLFNNSTISLHKINAKQ